MRLQTKHTSLLLLLAPSLAAGLSADILQGEPGELSAPHDAIESHPSIDVNSRRSIPTKDAPVDGKDGKPHLGPFVETEGGSSGSRIDDDQPPLKGRPDDYNIVDGKKIPLTNDGVMFDKNREHAQEGTTGTEGGVSEKDKTRKAREGLVGGRLQAQPESPKEQPPLPHSEERKIQSSKEAEAKAHGSDDADSTHYTGLDKPDDLPDKPQRPPLPDSANKDHLDFSTKPGSSGSSRTSIDQTDDDDGIIQPFHSFLLSLTMILVSEIGDKTFLVAALMAMKHDRMVVFSAAYGALLVMTVLSAVLGHAVPALIPRRLTSFLAAVLFFIFGGRLLREGMQMDPNEGVSAEMTEVEQELAEKEKEMGRSQGHGAEAYSLEMGLGGRRSRSRSRFPSPPRSPSQSPARPSSGANSIGSILHGMNNLFALLLSPAWVQTFVMTFLGEWGDRSQIATIAMAAGQDYWWVTLGAAVGHAVCTGAAVIGGRAIAGRVSLKVVTVGGAVAFLIFGFIYFFEALYG